jgi:hypothetical protein
MRLFQADSGFGNVFKDIQVERELRKEVKKDHEYLYILLDAIKDSERAGNEERIRPMTSQARQVPGSGETQEQAGEREGEEVACRDQGSAEQGQAQELARRDDIADLYKRFRQAKFNYNPGQDVYALLGKGRLGNVKWSKTSGIRDFIYGFFLSR